MVYSEIKKDLFTVDDKYYLAQCISSDSQLGAGIAVDFQRKFRLRAKLLSKGQVALRHPTCILIDRVFNLITKEKYWHKPTYDTLTKALEQMKRQAIELNIKHIAMPRIGSGLDRLMFDKVRVIIQQMFIDTDIEILVCYK